MDQVHQQHQNNSHGHLLVGLCGSPMEDDHSRHHQQMLQDEYLDSRVNGSGYGETETSMMMMMQPRYAIKSSDLISNVNVFPLYVVPQRPTSDPTISGMMVSVGTILNFPHRFVQRRPTCWKFMLENLGSTIGDVT